MGFGIVFSIGIILITLVSVSTVFYVILEESGGISEATSEVFETENTIEKTEFNISNLEVQAVNGTFHFMLNSTGSEKLWNYDDFDVIAIMDIEDGGQVITTTKILSYNNTTTEIGTFNLLPDIDISIGGWEHPSGGIGGGSAIAFDNSNNNSGNCNSSSCNITLNVGAGSNRMIILVSNDEGTPRTVTSVDINSNNNAGILVGTQQANAGSFTQRVEMWRIMESDLSTGSNTITVNYNAAVSGGGISVMSFSGVAQQAEEAEGGSSTFSSATISRTISTASLNSLIVSGVGSGQSGSWSSHGSGQVERHDFGISSARGGATSEVKTFPGTDTQSHTFSSTANRQAMYTASFAPVSVSSGNLTGLYDEINDEVLDINTYAESSELDSSNTSDVLLVGLSNALYDPQISDNHKVSYSYAKDVSGGSEVDLTVALYQGNIQIASWTHTNIGTIITTQEQLLTSLEINSITNYDDLRLEFTASCTVCGDARTAQVYAAGLQIRMLADGTSKGVNVDQWGLNSTFVDYLDPRIINYGEAASILGILNYTAETGTPTDHVKYFELIVSTDHGVTQSLVLGTREVSNSIFGVQILNRSDGGCLTVESTSSANGVDVDVAPCIGGDYTQIWLINPDGTITNILHGKCLDAWQDPVVEVWDCGFIEQFWTVETSGLIRSDWNNECMFKRTGSSVSDARLGSNCNTNNDRWLWDIEIVEIT